VGEKMRNKWKQIGKYKPKGKHGQLLTNQNEVTVPSLCAGTQGSVVMATYDYE
jgi:hypothetical protein